jgi:hypothetical protein
VVFFVRCISKWYTDGLESFAVDSRYYEQSGVKNNVSRDMRTLL